MSTKLKSFLYSMIMLKNKNTLINGICTLCYKFAREDGEIHKVRLRVGDEDVICDSWVCSECSKCVCDFCGKYDKEDGFQVRLADSPKDSYIGWLCFGCYDRVNEVDL